MTYNPIFELEDVDERDKRMKSLRDMISFRASKDQFIDFSSKLAKFVQKHPVVSISAAAILGLGFGKKK